MQCLILSFFYLVFVVFQTNIELFRYVLDKGHYPLKEQQLAMRAKVNKQQKRYFYNHIRDVSDKTSYYYHGTRHLSLAWLASLNGGKDILLSLLENIFLDRGIKHEHLSTIAEHLLLSAREDIRKIRFEERVVQESFYQMLSCNQGRAPLLYDYIATGNLGKKINIYRLPEVTVGAMFGKQAQEQIYILKKDILLLKDRGLNVHYIQDHFTECAVDIIERSGVDFSIQSHIDYTVSR